MAARYRTLFACVSLAFCFLLVLAPLAFADVATDKDEYAPGETVTISGDGYTPGENVFVEVLAPYGIEYGTAVANASGEFSWSFTLPNDDSALGFYSYSAIGESSGVVQSGTFSDGNVKIFPIPTTATYSATKTIYNNGTCTGSVVSGPTVVNGISSPSGHTTGVGNTESVKIQAAAFSDQGGSFLGWTTSQPYVGTSTTAVAGDTICIAGSFTGNRSYFANYGDAPGVLVVQKVLINDNGGTAATTTFSFQVNGASTTPFNAAGKISFSLASSTYTITELAAGGYTTTYSNSKNGNADCANLAVTSSATTTCTITNNDQPASLTLFKVVVNDNGGTATTTDWTLTATGPTGFGGFGPIVTNNDIDAGTYDLSENGPAPYTGSSWSCTGGNQTDSDTVEIGLGESVTCTITNDDDEPSLTLTKVVVGGSAIESDFTLTATGPTGFSGPGPSVSNGVSFDAGTYDLSESGPAGYTASDWVCDAGQVDGDTVSVGLGENVTCTITNTREQGSIELLKEFIGTSENVTLKIGTTTNGSEIDSQALSGNGTTGANSVDTGTYYVSETLTTPGNYTSSLACYNDNDHDGTVSGGDTFHTVNGATGEVSVGNGEDVLCVFTNTRKQGTLIVKKILINDNGGSAATTTFAFKVNAGSSQNFEADGENTLTVDTGVYSIQEDAAAGYTTTYSNSENGNADCANLALGEDDTIICTITNNDVAVSPVASCSVPPGSASIRIVICNTGIITSTTTAGSHTGVNAGGGSAGGNGGNGGGVDPAGNENNGGASAGNGGNGGNGGAGGLIATGDATSDARTENSLNGSAVEVDPLCDCRDLNSTTVEVIVDNDNPSNRIDNTTGARSRTGDNSSLGSQGGSGGGGGSIAGGSGDENNGGASAGSGGSGGAGASGGGITTGNAFSTSHSVNLGNYTTVRFGH